MKVLIDECLPRPLIRRLSGHLARTVQQMGWAGRKNGLLLRSLIAGGFEAFITVDKSLPFQQNLTEMPIVLIILSVSSNKIEDIAPCLPGIQTALATASPGDVIRLGTPEPPPAPLPAA